MPGANDPVGYRRGLVLGLTLAETLLLVLFILLLVYAALGQQRDKKMKDQEDQIASLSLRIDSGVDRLARELTQSGIASNPDELSRKLNRLTDEMARNAQLQKDLSTYQRLVPTASEAKQLADAFDVQQSPETPLQILDRHLARTTTAPATTTSDAPKTLAEALAAVERMSGQLDYYEHQQLTAGNGLSYPPCWQRDGRIVYMYDALLLDDGLRLSVTDDRTGLDLAGLRANGAEPPLGQTITRQTFLAQTKGLHAWSVTQGCRFYARIIDGTSAGNKSGYIQARRAVEDRFYPLVAAAAATPAPTP
ncbi:MAG TPA: hypothetical protein PLH23_03550 [Hyphomonadaceae bacterium]|nr:hypothetical protein [Hyphomonadaceae bacterium]